MPKTWSRQALVMFYTEHVTLHIARFSNEYNVMFIAMHANENISKALTSCLGMDCAVLTLLMTTCFFPRFGVGHCDRVSRSL